MIFAEIVSFGPLMSHDFLQKIILKFRHFFGLATIVANGQISNMNLPFGAFYVISSLARTKCLVPVLNAVDALFIHAFAIIYSYTRPVDCT